MCFSWLPPFFQRSATFLVDQSFRLHCLLARFKVKSIPMLPQKEEGKKTKRGLLCIFASNFVRRSTGLELFLPITKV